MVSFLLPFLFMIVFIFLFGAALVVVSGLLGPKPEQSATKKRAYESGNHGELPEHSRVSVRYYLTAILFILFDIEIIFMYPWAVTFSEFLGAGSGLYILLAMGVFLAIFIYGLFWEIKSKALEWD